MANGALCAVGTQSPHLQQLIEACSALNPAAASQLQTVMAGLASITILIPEQWNALLAELQVRVSKIKPQACICCGSQPSLRTALYFVPWIIAAAHLLYHSPSACRQMCIAQPQSCMRS